MVQYNYSHPLHRQSIIMQQILKSSFLSFIHYHSSFPFSSQHRNKKTQVFQKTYLMLVQHSTSLGKRLCTSYILKQNEIIHFMLFFTFSTIMPIEFCKCYLHAKIDRGAHNSVSMSI